MNKKRREFLSILLISLSLLTILLIPSHNSFSQSPIDRFPKDVGKIPLPKLLDIGANKCKACVEMAPILQELTEEYKGRVVIKVINFREEPQLTEANKIRLIPTQIFFDSTNREVYRHEGFMDKEQIKKVFQTMGVK
jgi:thioredoxin 1